MLLIVPSAVFLHKKECDWIRDVEETCSCYDPFTFADTIVRLRPKDRVLFVGRQDDIAFLMGPKGIVGATRLSKFQQLVWR